MRRSFFVHYGNRMPELLTPEHLNLHTEHFLSCHPCWLKPSPVFMLMMSGHVWSVFEKNLMTFGS